MRNVDQILFPVDFSEDSKMVFPVAVDLAKRFDATLHVLHVMRPMALPVWPMVDAGQNDELRQSALKRCDEQVREFTSDARTEYHVVEGTPRDEIHRFADEHEVDLLTLSTHGRSGIKRFVMGSTAERLVRTAPCNVLVVRPPLAGLSDLKKILVATDFSKNSELAVREAMDLAKPETTVLLAHVVEELDAAIGHVMQGEGLLNVNEQIRLGAQRQLEDFRDETIGADAPVEFRIGDGVPSAGIAQLAADEAVDLVVIASKGHSSVMRFLLGSTAERVVRLAPCSVWVVREKG